MSGLGTRDSALGTRHSALGGGETGDLARRIALLERRNRRLAAATAALAALWAATAAVEITLHAEPAHADAPAPRFLVADSVRVRQLIVVDSNGTERARVGAPLPDPIILGRRIPRGGAASGVLVSDADGNERGGYVTSDGYPNVFFTLDGLASQQVLFLTEPAGATALWLWGGNGNAFRASVGDGGARLQLERGGTVFFQQPAPDSARGDSARRGAR